MNNLRLLRDPLLLCNLPVSGFTNHQGESQAQKINMKNLQCADAKSEDKQDKQQSFPKKQQHPNIYPLANTSSD